MEKSPISHPNDGVCFFASQKNGKSEVVWYYTGSVVYANLTKKRHETNTYGERVKLVSADLFRKWANKLPQKITDK